MLNNASICPRRGHESSLGRGRLLSWRRKQSLFVLLVFFANIIGPFPQAQADNFRLPVPGVRVALSPEYNPPILKGIKVHPNNPFRFDFILDHGENIVSSPNALIGDPQQEQIKIESTKLIKYFLASLTIPEKDLWVNLSPYEKNRIVPESFGQTEMGRDLLAEDYILKQITASLIYPEGAVGRQFWQRIYEEAQKRFGTTSIPVNTFNKVWIVPEKAVVYENAQAGTAYVMTTKLKVMLEQDYLVLYKNNVGVGSKPTQERAGYEPAPTDINQLGSQIVREIVIPQLTKEVNEGKNFARLRQVYNSLILAIWYKKKIKDSILAQVYENKRKVAGVQYENSVILTKSVTPTKSVILSAAKDLNRINSLKNSSASPQNDTELIYQRYLQAFKKGAYNYIKEEIDPETQQLSPRKYFSGGAELIEAARVTDIKPMTPDDAAMIESSTNRAELVTADIAPPQQMNKFQGAIPMRKRGVKDSAQLSDQVAADILERAGLYGPKWDSVKVHGGVVGMIRANNFSGVAQIISTIKADQLARVAKALVSEDVDFIKNFRKDLTDEAEHLGIDVNTLEDDEQGRQEIADAFIERLRFNLIFFVERLELLRTQYGLFHFKLMGSSPNGIVIKAIDGQSRTARIVKIGALRDPSFKHFQFRLNGVRPGEKEVPGVVLNFANGAIDLPNHDADNPGVAKYTIEVNEFLEGTSFQDWLNHNLRGATATEVIERIREYLQVQEYLLRKDFVDPILAPEDMIMARDGRMILHDIANVIDDSPEYTLEDKRKFIISLLNVLTDGHFNHEDNLNEGQWEYVRLDVSHYAWAEDKRGMEMIEFLRKSYGRDDQKLRDFVRTFHAALSDERWLRDSDFQLLPTGQIMNGMPVNEWMDQYRLGMSTGTIIEGLRSYIEAQRRLLRINEVADGPQLASDVVVNRLGHIYSLNPGQRGMAYDSTDMQAKQRYVMTLVQLLTGEAFVEMNDGDWLAARQKAAAFSWGNDPRIMKVFSFLEYAYQNNHVTMRDVVDRFEEIFDPRPEEDPIKIAEAQDKFRGIVEQVLEPVLARHDSDILAITDEEWGAIIDQIFQQALEQNNSGLINNDFRLILEHYLKQDQLKKYVETFLWVDDQQVRPMGIQDVVLIVEFLHTLSIDIFQLGLRQEVLGAISLPRQITRLSFTYRFYRDVLSQHGWVGPEWDKTPIDSEVEREMAQDHPSEGKEIILGQDKSKIKAVCEAFGIVPAVFYFDSFRAGALRYGSQMLKAIQLYGSFDSDFTKRLSDSFNEVMMDYFEHIMGFREGFNGLGFFNIRFKHARSTMGSKSFVFDVVHYPPGARVANVPTPTPAVFFYDEIPQRILWQRQGVVESVRSEQEKDPRVLPVVPIKATQAQGPVIFKTALDAVSPVIWGILTTGKNFRSSVDGVMGRVLNRVELLKQIAGNKTIRRLQPELQARLRSLVENENNGAYLFNLIAPVSAKSVSELVAENLGLPGSNRRLKWAQDYMEMTDRLYQKHLVTDEDNLSYLYLQDGVMHLENVTSLMRRGASTDKDEGLKSYIITALIHIMLGVDFDFQESKDEDFWRTLNNIVDKDFLGDDRVVAQNMVTLVRSRYEQWDLNGFITEWQNDIKPQVEKLKIDLAMSTGNKFDHQGDAAMNAHALKVQKRQRRIIILEDMLKSRSYDVNKMAEELGIVKSTADGIFDSAPTLRATLELNRIEAVGRLLQKGAFKLKTLADGVGTIELEIGELFRRGVRTKEGLLLSRLFEENRERVIRELVGKKLNKRQIYLAMGALSPTDYMNIDKARGDKAMNGGIDLTPDKLLVQNDGRGIKFHMDPAILEKLRNAPGFTPLIVSIQPLVNIQAFLGFNSPANDNFPKSTDQYQHAA